MKNAIKRGRSGCTGVALVAVLWIVAALGILVTGMVQAQRGEVKLVAAARDAVQAQALGGAAIALVIQQLAAQAPPPGRLSNISVSYGGMLIAVQVLPLNGLIDINRAPEPLLAALFAVAGGVPKDHAGSLASALAASRQTARASGNQLRFEAIEDLLQLPGVDFDLYARLSPFITTDARGSGRVNPLAAGSGVLAVLAGGDTSRAAGIAAARDSGQTGIDTTSLSADFVDNVSSTRFKLQARVPMSDGKVALNIRTVDLGRAASGGPPWRVFQVENRVESQENQSQ